MKEEGILEKIQNAVGERLLALNELRNIPILTYRQSDLNSAMQANLKSGIGTVILLMPPIPTRTQPHVVGPVFGEVMVEIKIIENTVGNKSGKSLLSLAETVMQNLHLWSPGVSDCDYRLDLATGMNACEVDRRDDTNYFAIHFVIPYHIEPK
jgi:hypothetical protein